MTEIKKNNPIDTDADPSPKPGARRLRRYWTRGKGAAKIRWGVAGDFNRCVSHLRKYVSDPKGLCNVYHVAAVGAPPGQGHPGGKSDMSNELKETLIYAESLKQLSYSDNLKEFFAFLDDEEETKDMATPELEHKNISTASGVTETTADGIVEALVSVTGIEDNVGDIIKPGAYEKTLKTRMPKGVWSHDWNTPVSKVIDIKELMPGDPALPKTLANGEIWPSEAGALYVKAQFNLDTQRGRDAFADVKFFTSDTEWSIGYSVPKGKSYKDDKTGVRHIEELNLFEYSPVLFGAASNARSLISAAKSLFDSEDEFRKELKNVLEGEESDKSEDVEAAGNGTNEGECTCGHDDQSADPDELEEQTVTERTEEEDGRQIEQGEPAPTHEEAADSEARINPVDVPLDADTVKQLKSLHEQLTSVLSLISVKKAEPEFVSNKGLREAMDALIKGKGDSGIIEAIDNNVVALEAAIKMSDTAAINDNANDALDEITFALQDSATDDETAANLKALVAAIGESLKGVETAEAPVVEETPAPTTKSISLSADELKSLLLID